VIVMMGLTAAERREAALARTLFADRAGQRLARAIHLALATPRAAPAIAADYDPVHPPVPAPERRQPLDSPFAGFALLLPVLRALAIDAALSAGQARAMILAELDPLERMEPHAEAIADLLLPFPIEPELPLWPRARADDPDSACAEGWAAFVLAEFAERLCGLQASSAGYLRRQFLHIAGTLALDDERLTVTIIRPPLAIVLTMAMMTGDQGALPWRRDRALRILMP
jgi:hypothetical protein